MRKKLLFLFFACFILSSIAKAQVSVDPLTGAAQVNIPIYTVKSGQVAVPVSLSYNGSGVKTKDVEGTAGMGWQLNAGGQISRVVQGLPDDVTKDNKGNQRLGWMSSLDTAANNIAGFPNANNGICASETTDIGFINIYLPYRNDTEPDKFYVSAPGLSCQLVYDRASGKFKPTTYQDLVISFTRDATTNLIRSFTITNDKGITWIFGNNSDAIPATEKVTVTTSGGSQTYFKTKYQQYQNGITYYDCWSLLAISDAHGNSVNLNYSTPSPGRGSTDTVAVSIAGAAPILQYYIKQTVYPFTLASITVNNAYTYSPNALTFTWTTLNGYMSTGQTVISTIAGMGRAFSFNYSPVLYTGTSYSRSFLRTLNEPGCSSPVNYQFAYVGETYSLSHIRWETTLIDSTQNMNDYWGYYSSAPGTNTSRTPAVFANSTNTSYPRYAVAAPSSIGSAYPYPLGSVNRMADPANVAVGSLCKITTAQGGNSNIIYESNDYYDAPSGTIAYGGGVRVKQVVDSVVKGSTGVIIHNYSYLNPSTGLSSGKPISLPQYAFTIPYSGANTGSALWTSATAISTHDLSNEDHTILYQYSKVSQTNAGSTLYQYNVPATYWDLNATPSCAGCSTAEWIPTMDYRGRSNCTILTYGPVSNYTNAYPFIPNPNYDFERGLPKKITNYNDSGAEVSESNYTYQRSYSPSVITAFKYDDNPGSGVDVMGYNKYIVYYNTSELTTQVTKTVYDLPSLSQSHTETVAYTYGSTNHKLVTQEQTTNSDGSVLTSNIKYVKDYTVTSGTNINVTALYNMQQQNINVPVESYRQVTRSGTTVATAASLTLFRDTTTTTGVGTITHHLPSQQFKWVQPNGATFTPMSISGQVITKDANYFGAANYDIYDVTGFPLTTDDNYKHFQTTIIHHFAGKPIATFANAAYNQVAYSDFDSDIPNPDYDFTISGTGFTAVGSHAGNAYGLTATTQTVSHTVAKNTLAQNYIFSLWINAASGTNTLNISLNGGGATPYTYTGTGTWKYYEWKIPVSSMPSSFSFSFTSAQSISVDDILLYPDVATAATATYDATTYSKICETNTNGISAYYTNDQWGRLLYAYDRDKNMLQRYSYITPSDQQNVAPVSILAPTTAYSGSAVVFSNQGYNSCTRVGVSSQWNFGDGNSTTTGSAQTSHTYTNTGTYTVTLTSTSPLYGTQTATQTITVTAPPPPPTYVTLSYNNYTTSNGNITNVSFNNGGTITNISGSALNGYQMPRASSYVITVTLSGGTPYNSADGTGYGCVSTGAGCRDYDNHNTNTYSFSSVNFSSINTFNFSVYTLNCANALQ